MLLRVLLGLVILGTVSVFSATMLLAPPTGQGGVPPVLAPAADITPIGVPTIALPTRVVVTPVLGGPSMNPLTPNPNYTPGPVRVTERARRSAPMTDADVLADVQQRVLAKQSQAADATARRATLQPYQPQVHRYAPGQLQALSPTDFASLAVDATVPLAVVVVPWGAEARDILPQGPKRVVDYLMLVYDPNYATPSSIIWAPESGLVQAITGNRSKPTATPAPTANPTIAAAQNTIVARPTGPAVSPGQEPPGLQGIR